MIVLTGSIAGGVDTFAVKNVYMSEVTLFPDASVAVTIKKYFVSGNKPGRVNVWPVANDASVIVPVRLVKFVPYRRVIVVFVDVVTATVLPLVDALRIVTSVIVTGFAGAIVGVAVGPDPGVADGPGGGVLVGAEVGVFVGSNELTY